MPLTLSHPAAVLPLRRLGLPMTVLVIASMVPDIPLFLGSASWYERTHSTLGVVTLDVAATVVVVAIWFLVLRDALVDLAPAPVRVRIAARRRMSPREILLTPLAACLGATSHVVWDAFTHPGRWGAERIDWLRAEHAGLLGMKWAQYVSGVVGLAVVVIAALAYLKAAQTITSSRPPRALPAATLPVVVAFGAAAALVSAIRSAPSGLHAMAFNGVVDSLSVLACGLVLVCLAWHAARRRRS